MMDLIATLPRRLRRKFANEPFVWALLGMALQAVSACRNGALGWMLGAHDLRVGSGSILRGTRHITFGRAFHATGAVWIEAVTSYGGRSYSPRLVIGDDVSASLDLHVSCIEHVAIGNAVLLGSRVYISDHNHGAYSGPLQTAPDVPPAQRALGGGGEVIIGDRVWIGHNVVILGPARIEEGAVVAANSVVRGDVAARTVVAGAPARPIKRFDEESRTWQRTS